MDINAEAIPANAIAWKRYPWLCHIAVAIAMAALAVIMYGPFTDNAFQYDDEPNITENPEFKCLKNTIYAYAREMNEDADEDNPPLLAVLRGIWDAGKCSPARNRALTNATFAWNVYRNGYHIEEYTPPGAARPVNPVRDFHIYNIVIHWLCGIAVYGLVLRLIQLPRARKWFAGREYVAACVASLIWFCSPIQTQAVIYIVQRAVSLSTLFYVLAILFYLDFRHFTENRWARAWRQYRGGGSDGSLRLGLNILLGAFYLGLIALCTWASVQSKEIGATLPAAVILIEYCLIAMPRGSEKESFLTADICRSLRTAALPLLMIIIPAVIGVGFFYAPAKQVEADRYTEAKEVVRPGVMPRAEGVDFLAAAENIYKDAVRKVFTEEVRGKIKLTSRQRLITEARVVAMYQSKIFCPAYWRLQLNYDFLESIDVCNPEQIDWGTLALVLAVLLAAWFSPGKYKALCFICIYALAHLLGWSSIWTKPWPIPAILWHMALMGAAAWYMRREPLLCFCIAWFYLGQVVESSVFGLEVVYEHRLYLPSIPCYLGLVALLGRIFPMGVEHGESAVLQADSKA